MRGLQSCASLCALTELPVPPSFFPFLVQLQAGLIHLLAWLHSAEPAQPPRREKCSISREKHSICCQSHPGWDCRNQTAHGGLGGVEITAGEEQPRVGKPWEGWGELTWSHSCASASSLPALPASLMQQQLKGKNHKAGEVQAAL